MTGLNWRSQGNTFGSGVVASDGPNVMTSYLGEVMQYGRMDIALSEGKIGGLVNGLKSVYFNGTVLQNEDGTNNFNGVSIAHTLGTNSQGVIPGFESSESEVIVGTEVTHASPVIRTITASGLSAVRIRIGFNALKTLNPSTGVESDASVFMQVFIKKTVAGTWAEVLLSNGGQIKGKYSNHYAESFRIELPTRDQYDIKIVRFTPDFVAGGATDPVTVDKCFFDGYTEIVDARFRYPNTARLAVLVNSKQFPSVPEVHAECYGVEVDVPVNYDPVARTYTGIWNGTFKKAWTNNPAWLFYALATNTRWGAGNYLSASGVDKWALYIISKVCDEPVDSGKRGVGNSIIYEPRFTCSVHIQAQQDSIKALAQFTSCFRGMLYSASGVVVPTQDVAGTPSVIYTNANVKDGKFTYQGSARSARHTAVLVTWINPDNGYTQDVEYVEDQAGIARYGLNVLETEYIGCTSRAGAQRHGKYLLLSEKLETEVVSFSPGLDVSLSAPGTIVQVQDNGRFGSERLAGRVVSSTTTSVTPDAPVVIGPGTYYLKCRLSDGTLESRPVTNVAGTHNTLNVSAPFSSAPPEMGMWACTTAADARLYRIVTIKTLSPLNYDVVAVYHDPSKYDDSVLLSDAPTNNIIIPIKPVVSLSTTLGAFKDKVVTTLSATWSTLTNAIGFSAEWSLNYGPWSPMPVSGNSAELVNAVPGTYRVRVRALYPNGRISPSTEADTVVLDEANDGSISNEEQNRLGLFWVAAQHEKFDLDDKADALFGVNCTERQMYDSRYDDLAAYSSVWDGTIPPPIDTTAWDPPLNDMWSRYWGEKTFLMNAIAAKIQSNLDVQAAILGDIAADNKLTDNEKLTVNVWWTTAVNEKANLDAMADNAPVSRVAYDAAYSALDATKTLWTSAGTVTVDSTFYTKWKAYWSEQSLLSIAIAEKVNSDGKANLAELQGIASDNIISRGEKPVVAADWDAARADYIILGAKARALGVPYQYYIDAYSALDAQIATCNLANRGTDTEIDGPAFYAAWVAFDTATTKLQIALQSVTPVVDAATTNVVVLSGTSFPSVDSFTTVDGSRFLLAGQSPTSDNGVYSAHAISGSAGGTQYAPTETHTGTIDNAANIIDSSMTTFGHLRSSSTTVPRCNLTGFTGGVCDGTLSFKVGSYISNSDGIGATAYAMGVVRVEVSLDGGGTWGEVYLAAPEGANDNTTYDGTPETVDVAFTNVLPSNILVRFWAIGQKVMVELNPDINHNLTAFYATASVDIYGATITTGATGDGYALTKDSDLVDGSNFVVRYGSTHGGKLVAVSVNSGTGVATLTDTTAPYQVSLGNAPADTGYVVTVNTAGKASLVLMSTSTLTTADWNALTNKPSVFPPADHTHTFSNAAYADNAGSANSVAWSNVTGRPTTLSAFANDLVLSTTNITEGTNKYWTAARHDFNTLVNVPSTFTPSAHTQAFSTITGLPTTVAGYGILDAVPMSDPRLTDDRAPLHHRHSWYDLDLIPSNIGGGGASFPAGGTAGQALIKASNADNDVAWGDVSSGGSGGGSSWSFYDPDLEPVAPSALDDEFSGTALASKWTGVNWVSTSPLHTVTETAGKLYSFMESGGGSTFRAVLQPIPAGDFTIVTRAQCDHPSSYSAIGLMLSTTNTTATGSQHVWQSFRGYGFMQRAVTNFNTDGAFTNSGPDANDCYLRIRRAGTTYYFAWSLDGAIWNEQTVVLAITPAYFGVHIYANASSKMTSSFSYFRYYSTATATLGGIRTVGSGSSIPTDYITGLPISWVSNTSVAIGPGSAVIQASGAEAIVSSTVTVTGISGYAQTWVHLYLAPDGTVEKSPTAPSAPYKGSACSKPSDTSRRYIGSVWLTDTNSVPKFMTTCGGPVIEMDSYYRLVENNAIEMNALENSIYTWFGPQIRYILIGVMMSNAIGQFLDFRCAQDLDTSGATGYPLQVFWYKDIGTPSYNSLASLFNRQRIDLLPGVSTIRWYKRTYYGAAQGIYLDIQATGILR